MTDSETETELVEHVIKILYTSQSLTPHFTDEENEAWQGCMLYSVFLYII